MSLSSPEQQALGQALAFLSQEQQKQLAACLHSRELAAGELLFQVGAPASELVFLVSGRLAVEKRNTLYDRRQVIALLEPGALAGERALLVDADHRAEVRAQSDCTLLLLDRRQLEALARDDAALYTVLLRQALAVAALRLDKASERLAEVL